jgi:hypothetical protein
LALFNIYSLFNIIAIFSTVSGVEDGSFGKTLLLGIGFLLQLLAIVCSFVETCPGAKCLLVLGLFSSGMNL